MPLRPVCVSRNLDQFIFSVSHCSSKQWLALKSLPLPSDNHETHNKRYKGIYAHLMKAGLGEKVAKHTKMLYFSILELRQGLEEVRPVQLFRDVLMKFF